MAIEYLGLSSLNGPLAVLEGVMSCRASFQRTGGWCEPGRGGRAAGAGAGGPNERSSRASRGRRRYQGAGLLEPE